MQALIPEFDEAFFEAVSLVHEQFSLSPVHHIGQWRTIIGVAWCDLDGHQFAAMVHHNVQFEAEKPAHGRAALRSQPLESSVRLMRGLAQTASLVLSAT